MASMLQWPDVRETNMVSERIWVLLADDDVEMRQLLAQTLRDAGFRVTEAADPTDIPDAFGNGVPGPLSGVDLVVADVRMPELSGLDLVARLRENDWSTPVMLISAFADDELRRHAVRVGATRVLAKPFGLGEFVDAVRELTS